MTPVAQSNESNDKEVMVKKNHFEKKIFYVL